jgi:hypothetical protein
MRRMHQVATQGSAQKFSLVSHPNNLRQH